MIEQVVPTINSLIKGFGDTLLALLPISIALGLIFTALSLVSASACNPGKRWWQKPDLATDLCYWFVIPLFTRFLRIGLLVLGGAYIFGLTKPDDIIDFFEHGHGMFGRLPLWVQVSLYLVLSDFMLYWMHRAFHGASLWKFHAVHHSSEELEWISAGRFHPVNLFLGTVMVDIALLFAGLTPDVLIFLSPFNTAMSAFVHANLNWTLGPLKYVIASPVFHRWHHTANERGGGRNFASTFPVFDLLFGTFYMPERELPDHYGIEDKTFPGGFGEQLAYPFKHDAGSDAPRLNPKT
jgi:sterol desaturase/sphingolipid hydroxylase (fatty acid hydroxylase superfamily)